MQEALDPGSPEESEGTQLTSELRGKPLPYLRDPLVNCSTF